MDVFIDRAVHQIVSVKYFSAYATWMPGPYARHQLYAALKNSGVNVVLGQFKKVKVIAPPHRGHSKELWVGTARNSGR
jgi:hypothetical protein